MKIEMMNDFQVDERQMKGNNQIGLVSGDLSCFSENGETYLSYQEEINFGEVRRDANDYNVSNNQVLNSALNT